MELITVGFDLESISNHILSPSLFFFQPYFLVSVFLLYPIIPPVSFIIIFLFSVFTSVSLPLILSLPSISSTPFASSTVYFFYPLPSMWTDEPGDPRPGHIHGLRCCKCPAVSDGRNAHSTPLHPEKRGRRAPHRLPAQPQPRRRELHFGCTSTCSNQRRPAHPRLRTALAEVHHLLWERLRWVWTNETIWWSDVFHKHGTCKWDDLSSFI